MKKPLTLLPTASQTHVCVLIDVPNKRINKEDARLRAKFPQAYLCGNFSGGRRPVQENGFLVAPKGTDFEAIIKTMGWREA